MYGYTTDYLFIHHLGCFHFRYINAATRNIHVYVLCAHVFIYHNYIMKSGIARSYGNSRASLVAQMVNNLPAMQETWVLSLGRAFLEKRMATHFNILAWRIPRTEDPGRLQSMGSQRVRTTEQLIHTTHNTW